MQQPMRFLLKTTSVISVAVVLLFAPAQAQTPGALADSTSRVALVIGNSAYRSVAPLPNPVNDAELVGVVQALGCLYHQFAD